MMEAMGARVSERASEKLPREVDIALCRRSPSEGERRQSTQGLAGAGCCQGVAGKTRGWNEDGTKSDIWTP